MKQQNQGEATSSLTLTVCGEDIIFREPGLTEWTMCLALSKTDDQAANMQFVKACCVSHDGQQLQAIFERKPLAITKAFGLLYKAMNEGIEEKK